MSESRIRLAPCTLAEIRRTVEDLAPAERAQVSAAWLAELKAATAADPWRHGFKIELCATGARIGTAGFKGPPDESGMVEIAYAVDQAHRGCGYATETAQALVAWARSNAPLSIVRAHTLPEPNASTRVLQKAGFVHAGAFTDPEDGPVWRWELHIDPTPTPLAPGSQF